MTKRRVSGGAKARRGSRGARSRPRAISVANLASTTGAWISTQSRRAFRRLPLHWRILIAAPALAITFGLATFGVLLIYYTIVYPDPLTLRSHDGAPIIRILARDGSVLAERGAAHAYMPIDLLPPVVTNAVIATEDRRFHEHWGVDPIGMARAFLTNLRAGRFAQGGSTLTQQLAKNLFLSPERSLGRKVEELTLALWLELRLSKKEILELYLNRVYFGGGAYGIEAAAQRYFDKSARQLNIAEAAIIAGLLKAPSRYAPTANAALAIARGHSVLQKMRDGGFITDAELDWARGVRVLFARSERPSERDGIGYAIDYTLERLPPVIGPGQAELIVDTTIERKLQETAMTAVGEALGLKGAALSAGQGAFIVIDTEGGIRAMVGGRSYAESQFNRAVKARRQPGSAFKPFVYLAALESGFAPDSIAYDLPVTISGWSPRNESGKYEGPVSLRRALSQSINTVAVRLIMDAGPQRVAALAARLGIESPLRADASLALGTSEVSLLELTGAYGAFATGGRLVTPHIIRRIRSPSGRILYAREAAPFTQLAAPRAVGNLNAMLAEVMRTGTGKRAQLELHEAAGKTGTSQEFRDAWFVGYTAHLIGGVWIGNDNGDAMNRVMGGSLPAEIWKRVMQAAHRDETPIALPGAGTSSETHVASGATSDRLETGTAGPAPLRPELLPWTPSSAALPMPARRAGSKLVHGGSRNQGKGPGSPGKPPKPAVSQHLSAPRHPTTRIDADFIARAVAEAERTEEDGAAGARTRPQAPAGMMSLGVEPR